jgi:hypothetical protein
MRTFARPVNHGIRLDYFICSDNLFGEVEALAAPESSAADATGAISEMLVEEITESTTVSAESQTVTKSKRVKKAKVVEVVQPARALIAIEQHRPPIPHIYDSYMLYEDTVGISDHCPAVLVVRIA